MITRSTVEDLVEPRRTVLDCFLINLESDKERLDRMSALLSSHCLPFTRIPGVRGDQLTGADREYASDVKRRHLTSGEIGILISHLRAWRHFLEGSAQFALVLEDDLHFSNDFGQFVSRLQLRNHAPCVHKLETMMARVTLQREPIALADNRAAYELVTSHGGAAAYMLDRATASYLLSQAHSFTSPIDWELFDPDKRCARDLKVIQWLPAPAIQDQLLGSKRELTNPSNLEGKRSLPSNAQTTHGDRVINFIKSVLRPTYTALYSAILWRKGQKRTGIAFG